MPNQSTRNIIDYALDENGIEFRKELYASIHDRVAAHIESKKQEIAGSIFGQNEEVEELGEYSLEDYSLEEIQDFMQTEDFEQLDELSKEKLGNYIKRASMDASERAYNAGSFSGNNKPGSVAYKKGYHNSVTKQLDIHGKRQTGIQNAVNRLAKDFMQTEDFEQLDELSKEKLGNYIKRASMDASERAYNAGSFSGNNKPGSVAYKKGYHNSVTKQLDIHGKRQTGIQNAVNRLAKDFMKTDGYDSRGAYEKHDPKHPDFAKNYKKYKATNPQGQIGDFVAHMKKQKGSIFGQNEEIQDFMKTEGYDSRGAYEKHDPKHPDFAKNYKKYKATNPQGQIGDFVAHMKKQK